MEKGEFLGPNPALGLWSVCVRPLGLNFAVACWRSARLSKPQKAGTAQSYRLHRGPNRVPKIKSPDTHKRVRASILKINASMRCCFLCGYYETIDALLF